MSRSAESPDGCIFCLIAAGLDEREFIAFRDEQTLVIPSLFQSQDNLGHCIVIPVEHWRGLHDLPQRLYVPLLTTVRNVSLAIMQAFGADGTSIQQNNESPGQSVFHMHIHVIPRFDADATWRPRPPLLEQPPDERRRQRDAVAGAMLTARR